MLIDSISDFQMTYAQRSWAEERASWNAVILLNLARSVNFIVDILTEELDATQPGPLEEGSPTNDFGLTEQHKSLTRRLAPLRQIEWDLRALLGSGSSEGEETREQKSSPEAKASFQEFALRSSSGWKSVLDHIRNPAEGKAQTLHQVACNVIIGCKDDIRSLWSDAAVQQILQRREVRLEDTPGL